MDPQTTSTLILFGIALFVTLVVFLICREIVCWYWKINKSVQLLEQILEELKVLNRKS